MSNKWVLPSYIVRNNATLKYIAIDVALQKVELSKGRYVTKFFLHHKLILTDLARGRLSQLVAMSVGFLRNMKKGIFWKDLRYR